ncbi:MAG: hypothetical protein DHS80DRAFT_30024 [Piptocephalis tieghemiana]|nr:MAG: hypothetical protein DHS80DRAFT_30024 [Piptocephalis tieghemiana]
MSSSVDSTLPSTSTIASSAPTETPTASPTLPAGGGGGTDNGTDQTVTRVIYFVIAFAAFFLCGTLLWCILHRKAREFRERYGLQAARPEGRRMGMSPMRYPSNGSLSPSEREREAGVLRSTGNQSQNIWESDPVPPYPMNRQGTAISWARGLLGLNTPAPPPTSEPLDLSSPSSSSGAPMTMIGASSTFETTHQTSPSSSQATRPEARLSTYDEVVEEDTRRRSMSLPTGGNDPERDYFSPQHIQAPPPIASAVRRSSMMLPGEVPTRQITSDSLLSNSSDLPLATYLPVSSAQQDALPPAYDGPSTPYIRGLQERGQVAGNDGEGEGEGLGERARSSQSSLGPPGQLYHSSSGSAGLDTTRMVDEGMRITETARNTPVDGSQQGIARGMAGDQDGGGYLTSPTPVIIVEDDDLGQQRRAEEGEEEEEEEDLASLSHGDVEVLRSDDTTIMDPHDHHHPPSTTQDK